MRSRAVLLTEVFVIVTAVVLSLEKRLVYSEVRVLKNEANAT